MSLELLGPEPAYQATLMGLFEKYQKALEENDLEHYQYTALNSIETYEICHSCEEKCEKRVSSLLEEAARLESRLLREIIKIPTEERAA